MAVSPTVPDVATAVVSDRRFSDISVHFRQRSARRSVPVLQCVHSVIADHIRCLFDTHMDCVDVLGVRSVTDTSEPVLNVYTDLLHSFLLLFVWLWIITGLRVSH